jgi:tetratricopeptide (TPR) repeat protein
MHHTGDFEQAHALLARAPRTPTDPWLIAGEITFAGIAGRPARFLRVGRRMLEDAGIPPVHLSELASVLATIELDAGHAVHARRLFRKALRDPNDNALAQAEWAAGIIKLNVEPQLFSVPSSWEARALAAAAAGEAEPTLNEAWGWFYDQPFASGPAIFGSYQASKHGHFEEGAKFAKAGATANPGSFQLRNNLAFCLAKLGQTARAQQELSRIHDSHLDRDDHGTIEATRGLIAFRSGDSRTGREHYRRALSLLTSRESRVLALINLAVETFRVDPLLGEPLARQSHEEAAKLGASAAGHAAWLGHLPTGPKDPAV